MDGMILKNQITWYLYLLESTHHQIFNTVRNAGVLRKSCLQKCIERLLICKEILFYGSIKENKLLTSTSFLVKFITRANGKRIILKADRNTFSRLLLVRKKCGISRAKCYSFLDTVALSLANVDRTIFKTVKSKLFDEIEKGW